MCIHPKKKKSYSALSRLQAFANAVLADGMKKGRELVVGSISKEVVMDLQQKGITLETKDVTIDDAVIVKYIKHVKNQKGSCGRIRQVLDGRENAQKYHTYL